MQIFDNRLHCSTGPAVSWPNGARYWFWRGVQVSQQIIEAPETLTAKQIISERNAEVRRVMLERFGQERYIRESGAKVVHQDDWGTLWQATLPGDEPLLMVEVTNSTPEPGTGIQRRGHDEGLDGEGCYETYDTGIEPIFKDYWLRVPPTMRRAREAIAWTFGMSEDDYVLSQQT